MKFAAAYYLLLIYLTVMLQPLIPIAKDALVHCFAEAYHVATVHAKYGNDHVEKEMADINSDTGKSNKSALKEDDTIAVHIAVIEQTFNTDIFNPEILYSIQNKSALQKISLGKIVPPPKFS